MEEEFISVGKILNFHGIKGEIKAGYSNKSLISHLKFAYLEKNGIKTKYDIETVKFHKNFAIIKFDKINSINDMIEFKGKNIYVSKNEVVSKLQDNEFLIDDLIGMKVFDDKENFIGNVTEVLENSAQNILSVEFDGKKTMIPFVRELVPIVDVKTKKIIIKPIGGLL